MLFRHMLRQRFVRRRIINHRKDKDFGQVEKRID